MKDTDNIKALLDLEPDYIGFIFYTKSKRYMNNPNITDLDFKNSKKTGVFVNEKVSEILLIAQKYQLDVIQLHGSETPQICKEIRNNGYKVIKVFSVDNNFDFTTCKPYYDVSDWFLFDTKGELHGGNGIAFNWEKLNEYNIDKNFFLSGGISKEHIQKIKALDNPNLISIDINSQFENKNGLKNIQQLKTFFYEIRN